MILRRGRGAVLGAAVIGLCVAAPGPAHPAHPAKAQEGEGKAVAARGRPSISQHIFEGSDPRLIGDLLGTESDPLAPDGAGDTAVHYAASARDPAYLKLLLARGLSPDAPNAITGRTPLMSAMISERDAQVAMLLAAGASVSKADAMGNTPLHVAAQINEPKHVLTFLEANAPADARNAQGQTFQRYLFMTPGHLLNEETLRSRQAVASWLRRHDIALETSAP
jgi:hypothetical protein